MSEAAFSIIRDSLDSDFFIVRTYSLP
jgi:hypothetical protein